MLLWMHIVSFNFGKHYSQWLKSWPYLSVQSSLPLPTQAKGSCICKHLSSCWYHVLCCSLHSNTGTRKLRGRKNQRRNVMSKVKACLEILHLCLLRIQLIPSNLSSVICYKVHISFLSYLHQFLPLRSHPFSFCLSYVSFSVLVKL